MTELLNAAVSHKIFGNGTITDLTNGYITVSFDTFEKKFVYPEAFRDFLNLQDSVISMKVNKVIKVKEEQELKEKEDRELIEKTEEARRIQERFNAKLHKKTSKAKKKTNDRRNLAFKCNYCNGGESLTQIGYNGVCSDAVIQYNIEKKHLVSCSDEESNCQKYHNENITREELDGLMTVDGCSFCYESQMLKNWKASAGKVQYGENKGNPKKLKNVQYNSLALLTTRLPSTKEEERIIFGAFLIDDIFEGDDDNPGYVSTKSEYKIKLTLEESQKMKFWSYYTNPNKKDVVQWGSGLFRYLNDDQAIQILCALVELKANSPEAQLAKDFLDHFCQINQINAEELHEEVMVNL